MFGKVLCRSAIVAAAFCAVAPAQATSFLFTNSGSTALSGTAGNTFSLTVDGITVTASAWSTSNGTTSAAFLGRYSGSAGGLGVTNSREGNGDNNRHTIDNLDGLDFVALSFSQAVNLTSLNKTNYRINGSTDGGFFISYLVAGDNEWSDVFNRGQNYGTNDTFSNANFSSVWLIGAARNDRSLNDGFKLAAANVIAQRIVPQVPEPATWAMMIGGFGLMGAGLRRRSTKLSYAAAA